MDMKKGRLSGALGVISGVLAILAFLGYQNYKDFDKKTSPDAGRPTAAATAPDQSASDPEKGKWDYIHLADTACYSVTVKVEGLADYSPRSPTVWPKAVSGLRARMLSRWKKVGQPDDPFSTSFGDETRKIWSDFSDANWWWSEMIRLMARGEWDDARSAYKKFKIYDDAAMRRANRLGYSNCDYDWPRFTSW
ncbi:hypothetical protein ACWGH8_13760 [Nonomuraea muscovyensis]|uniref:Uncharacterized protein n=1 Tax=Nonomuraea muscovyensis TaxID=1124761 RepID=A0A7X0EZ46_9ACTN|nr:hypothetical protein [Nonomuraea muscovyensis]MBB6346415.1 hypothetical protein [Nonomuraea muscovyensis]